MTNAALAALRPLLSHYARLWTTPSVEAVQCVVNPRLSVSLGRYRSATNVIELSPRLFGRDWRVRREVVCHEAAHAAVRSGHGPSAKPHGPEWQRLMRIAGFGPRVGIPASPSNASNRTPSVAHVAGGSLRAPLPGVPVQSVRPQARDPLALCGVRCGRA